MLDVFKARLKAKTKAAGVNLSQKRIDAFADRLHKKNPDLAADAEADHDAAIDTLDELVSFADVAKEDDRVRTLEARTRQQQPPKKQDDDDDEDDDDEGAGKGRQQRDRTPKWAKDLMAEVQALKSEKRVTTIQQRISEKLKDKKIPEKFYAKRALPQSDDELDTFISEIEADWNELTQDTNNQLLGGITPPAAGAPGGNAAAVDKDIEAWAGAEAKK